MSRSDKAEGAAHRRRARDEAGVAGQTFEMLERSGAATALIACGPAQGTGVRFVAVGAARLAGPDSVQAALKPRGIAAERVGAR